jgi:predicted aspartyl protease
MVDTGCSYPMSVPQAYADAAIRVGLATAAGETKSTLADGKDISSSVIMIKSITVDGRTLHDVQAIVSESNTAPILLGLGALDRLGPYSIEGGRLVFTGEQPA